MRRFLTIASLAVLCTSGLANAQDDNTPPMDSAMAAMMAEWAKYSTPGPQHKQMEKQLGKWTYVSTMWMDPSQPPTESRGTSEVTSMLGGRFFRSDYQGDMMGMPFEGVSISGFDNFKQEYMGIWIDNLGTMMMSFSGTCNEGGRVCTYTTGFDDPILKVRKSVREVCRWTSDDTWVLEWYETILGQPEHKTMEIVHNRVK